MFHKIPSFRKAAGLVAAVALAVPAAALAWGAEGPDFSPGGPVPDDQLSQYHVVLDCAVDGAPVGSITLMMWPEKAPITVRNFYRHVSEGFYDGLGFHRVLRDFMIQGGDPNGDGSGNGKYGMIKGEFSDDDKYGHRYGVISMARTNDPNSASCQFFICCADGGSVWNLDGQYASFGHVVDGVEALEAIADVPTTFGGREKSKPTKTVTITGARVVEGAPAKTARVARPTPDLGGEPEKVTVQHCLISFAGRGTQATRSQEEAETLAADILARANAGEDFEKLVREYSDDPPREPNPGVYAMTNKGCVDVDSERKQFEVGREFQKIQQDLAQQVREGKLDQAAYQTQLMAKRDELLATMGEQVYKREGMAPAFGDVSFSLQVDEIGVAPFEAQRSPFGWHIIKRLK